MQLEHSNGMFSVWLLWLSSIQMLLYHMRKIILEYPNIQILKKTNIQLLFLSLLVLYNFSCNCLLHCSSLRGFESILPLLEQHCLLWLDWTNWDVKLISALKGRPHVPYNSFMVKTRFLGVSLCGKNTCSESEKGEKHIRKSQSVLCLPAL